MTRIAGIEIVQAATFQRVSSGNVLLICGRLWFFVTAQVDGVLGDLRV